MGMVCVEGRGSLSHCSLVTANIPGLLITLNLVGAGTVVCEALCTLQSLFLITDCHSVVGSPAGRVNSLVGKTDDSSGSDNNHRRAHEELLCRVVSPVTVAMNID